MDKWTSRNKDGYDAEAEIRIAQAIEVGSLKLDLSNLGLTELPKSLKQMKNLQELYIFNNSLTQLPEWIGQFQMLERLSLFNNQLTQLPESIGQLVGLQMLELSSNQLIQLPESIGQLLRLKTLNLIINQLSQIPTSIGQLQSLQELNLSSNRITQLPEWIGQLQGLRSLSLSSNQLTQLPESLGQLQRLEELNLTSNCLVSLPRTLFNLQALRGFYIHKNQKLNIPAELLGPTWIEAAVSKKTPATPSGILGYYFRVQEGKKPLNEAKLILVGRGNVGKTSLVNQLVHNKFVINEQKTEGIQITQWALKLQNEEKVLLHVWDFGGQEIMHATHQFFLTHRSIYLLVLNGRQGGEDADAEYWLKLIESFGQCSPVLIVLNKINEHPFDLNRRSLMLKYPFIKNFIKTDCKEETGINQLLESIQQETDQLEHLRIPFPSSWFTIKHKLSILNKSLLSFEEFKDICRQEGEQDATEQESLAQCLHYLGIALNYKDDYRLQGMHVLNPHWVTNSIYKILNAPQLEEQKGVLRVTDVSRILDSTEYPPQMRQFILDLMKRFKLCFGFPEDDGRYLIPELLDKEEPHEAENFKNSSLELQYHYSILPEGLLPRFIVYTHMLSEGHPRWRTGAILRFEDNIALVKADVQDKKVFIKVSGPISGRRRLLAIIRSDFERIHHDMRYLDPLEMVPLPEFPQMVIPYKKLQVMEDKHIKAFPEVVDDDVIDVNVLSLLNGVDLRETRRRNTIIGKYNESIRLCYSYSHKDETLRNELETHLKLLQRQGLISTWHDRQIEAGEEWKQRIDNNLESADIMLLLVSSDFFASDYCWEKEMKRAMERHEKGEAVVVPVILREIRWSSAPFAKLQALPKDALPVTSWPNKDLAWCNVAEGIEKVAEEVWKKRGFI